MYVIENVNFYDKTSLGPYYYYDYGDVKIEKGNLVATTEDATEGTPTSSDSNKLIVWVLIGLLIGFMMGLFYAKKAHK